MSLEIINLIWAITGTILNDTVTHTSTGAIKDCMQDYGFITPLFIIVFIVLGYA